MRELLPARRMSEVFEIQLNNHEYQIGIGYYNDLRPGEIFIDAGKAGTDLRTTAHDLAVALSIALQHGAKIEDMRHTFARDESGEPQGIAAAVLDTLMLRDVAEAAE